MGLRQIGIRQVWRDHIPNDPKPMRHWVYKHIELLTRLVSHPFQPVDPILCELRLGCGPARSVGGPGTGGVSLVQESRYLNQAFGLAELDVAYYFFLKKARPQMLDLN